MKIDSTETWFILSDEHILTTTGYKSAESKFILAKDSSIKKATKYMHMKSDVAHIQDEGTLIYRHYYKKI